MRWRTTVETAMKNIRVLLVVRHPIVCEALKMLLDSSEDMTFVGVSEGDDFTLRTIASQSIDVVLLDLSPSGVLALIPRIAEVRSGTRVLVFTALRDVDMQYAVLLAGACGIVTKDKPGSVILQAIRKVAAGELWFERKLLEAVVCRSTGAQDSRDALTVREEGIVALIGEGLCNAEIGKRLSISEKTVRNHLTSIFDKLGVSDRLKLLVYACRHGILNIPAKEAESDTIVSAAHPRTDLLGRRLASSSARVPRPGRPGAPDVRALTS